MNGCEVILGLASPCDRPSLSISLQGGCAGLRSWLVLWPGPAHACNAVCNEKSKQGTAVRHDRNVFPLEGAPKKKKEKRKKEEWEETLRQSYVQKEHSLGPKRKTNVIVHRLSLCQPSLTNWLMVSLPVSLPPHSLSACSVCSGGQWHSSKWGPVQPRTPPSRLLLSARMAIDCVIKSECGGAWGELEEGPEESWKVKLQPGFTLDGREQENEGQTLQK